MVQLWVSCFGRWTVTGDHNSYLFSWSFRTFPKCDVFVFSTLVTWSFSLFLRLSSSWICFFFLSLCVFFKEVIKRWESVRRSVWRRLTAGWKGHFQKDKKLGVGYFTSVVFPGISANGAFFKCGAGDFCRSAEQHVYFFTKTSCKAEIRKALGKSKWKTLDESIKILICRKQTAWFGLS